nr:MAG TPA: hypothetical protein [Caudoviricetes sp.]
MQCNLCLVIDHGNIYYLIVLDLLDPSRIAVLLILNLYKNDI